MGNGQWAPKDSNVFVHAPAKNGADLKGAQE